MTDEAWMEKFDRQLDNIVAMGNVMTAAVRIRYGASVMSRDEEHAVLLVNISDWNNLDNQLSMFMAVADREDGDGDELQV